MREDITTILAVKFGSRRSEVSGTNKMTNSASKIFFSLNLRKSALCELDFLRQISEKTFVDDPDLLRIAVHRYEHFWLPFLLKVHLLTTFINTGPIS